MPAKKPPDHATPAASLSTPVKPGQGAPKVIHEREQNANAESGELGHRKHEDRARLVRPRSDKLPPPTA